MYMITDKIGYPFKPQGRFSRAKHMGVAVGAGVRVGVGVGHWRTDEDDVYERTGLLSQTFGRLFVDCLGKLPFRYFKSSSIVGAFPRLGNQSCSLT